MKAIPCLAALTAGLLASHAPARAQQPIRGFPSSVLAGQVAREASLRAIPRADSVRDRIRLLSENPHEAGTDRSRHVAELILARFKAYGLDAQIEEFEALMPRPITRTLELVAPEQYTAQLKEPAIPEDKDSGDANQLPTFNAYSADGDVTAPLVYVNYGIPEDYHVLDSLGISVAGKIVIARYGRSWRGIKPKVAAEHGALGCIIYSDPRDDGYYVDDIYPKGPMRPWQGVQRGSVMDMPKYPGDPLSPGWASEKGAHELTIDQAQTLMSIPVLPISYGDALPLLRNLSGPVAPPAWRGALPITYHIGPGAARVHLALKFDWQSRPLYDVIARIPGTSSKDQWVIYGNHHDAWVNGAEDPLSGQAALLETARALGQLRKSGWKPARTIVLAAWDGEEWGLLGSTEWAEKHQQELRDHAVTYINSDTNEKGWLGASGSHSLETFVRQVARDIPDPTRGMSVLEAWRERREHRQGTDSVTFHIGALGSGSDYTVFLDFLGLPSLNLSYGGGSHAGIYHSIYDSFDFYRRFLDTTFVYGVTEAQTTGTALLRLADAPVLPFDFGAAASTYQGYADELDKEAKDSLKSGSLDLSAVHAAVQHVQDAATRYDSALAAVDRLSARDIQRRWKKLAVANQTAYRAEQALTDSAGLPQRSWFHHLIYAPGYYTGYGVKTMPGIREAVEDQPDAAVAQAQAARVAAALERYAEAVARAADQLREALR